MKRIREINWECRSKWPKLLNYEHSIIAEWIKSKYYDLITDYEMLDLESIVIISREQHLYRVEFKIRTMLDNTIIGSRYVLENAPINELLKLKKN